MTGHSEQEREQQLDAAIEETQAVIDEIRDNGVKLQELMAEHGIEDVPRLADVLESGNTAPEMKKLAAEAMEKLENLAGDDRRPAAPPASRKSGRKRRPPRPGAVRI